MGKIRIDKGNIKLTKNKFLKLENNLDIKNGLYKLNGDNGSGKTLFLESLSGMRRNEKISTDIEDKNILYLGESGIGVEDLTIIENIKLCYWIFGIKFTDEMNSKINKIYSEDQLTSMYSNASFGMKLLVGLSLLLTDYKWELIILDKTLAGIDKENKQTIINELVSKKMESIIFIVSHEEFKNESEFTEVNIINDKIQL